MGKPCRLKCLSSALILYPCRHIYCSDFENQMHSRHQDMETLGKKWKHKNVNLRSYRLHILAAISRFFRSRRGSFKWAWLHKPTPKGSLRQLLTFHQLIYTGDFFGAIDCVDDSDPLGQVDVIREGSGEVGQQSVKGSYPVR